MEGGPPRGMYKQVMYHSEADSALSIDRWGELDRSVPYTPSSGSGDDVRSRRKALNRTWPPQEHEQAEIDRREQVPPPPQLASAPSPHGRPSRRGSVDHRGSPTLPPPRVPCRGAAFGCTWTGLPQSVFPHESTCTLALISQRLFQLEAANSALNSKLEILQQDLQEAEEWPIKFRELQLRAFIRDFFLDPLPGFTLDSSEMLSWVCGIPGKKDTLHEGAIYELTLEFGYHPSAGRRNKLLFPYRPPRVLLSPYFFHPNVYSSGEVGLPILMDEKLWDPSITIKEILLTVQEFLTRHHLGASVQEEPWKLATTDPVMYKHRMAKQAESRRPKARIDIAPLVVAIESFVTPEKKVFSPLDDPIISPPDKLESPDLALLDRLEPSLSSLPIPDVPARSSSSTSSLAPSFSKFRAEGAPAGLGGELSGGSNSSGGIKSGDGSSSSNLGGSMISPSSAGSGGGIKPEKRSLSEWTMQGKYRVYLFGVEIED